MDPISFGHLWPMTLGVLKRHAELLVPVALAFLFLPQLLFNWHVGDTPPADLFGADRWPGDLVALAFLLVFSLIGQLVISFIAVRDGTAGHTLGAVLQRSAGLLLPALAVSMMQGLAVGFGLLLFILPGLWLLSRLVLVVPLVATEAPDPVRALKASWRLTEGNALKILGMLSLLLVGFILLSLAINGLGAAFGVLSTVAAGEPDAGWGLGRWLFEGLTALASTLIGAVYLGFVASLYRALAALPGKAG